MIGLLRAILCWIKQIGAMVLNALIEFVNLLIAAIGAAAQGLIDAWPVSMPDLPGTPSELVTAFGWLKWSPFPLAAIAALFAFLVTATLAWMAVRPLLRWLKVDA
jgi:hypothetical protein